MALTRQDVPRPVIRKETVPVESLGGEVIVRQLLLTELLELGRRKLEREESLLQVLCWCCIDPSGEPLFSRDEWQAWGAAHPDEAAALYNTADRLTDFDAKKAIAPS